MKIRILHTNLFVVVGIDILLLILSLYTAHLVRFDFNLPEQQLVMLKQILPFILVIKVICFYFFDLYSGMWRYTSISDLLNVIKAVSISTLLIILFILLRYRFAGFSRSVFLIDTCFSFLFILGIRLCIRLYYEHLSEGLNWSSILLVTKGFFKRKKHDTNNLLIIGAGNCGEKILREIRDNARLQYNVVGFLDDDPAKDRNENSWSSSIKRYQRY